MKILSTDTETNGLKNTSNAISIAVVMAEKNYDISSKNFDEDLNNVKSIYTLIDWRKIKPDFNIGEETTEIHGLKNEDLNGAPGPIEAYAECYRFVKEYLNGDKLDIINGYNVTFDLNMIVTDLIEVLQYCNQHKGSDKFDENDAIDVAKFLDLLYAQDSGEYGAQIMQNGFVITSKSNGTLVIDSIIIDRIFHNANEYGVRLGHSLSQCSARYGLEPDDNAHDALADTLQTIETFNRQINELVSLGIDVNTPEFEKRLVRKYHLVESTFAKKGSKSKPYNGRI